MQQAQTDGPAPIWSEDHRACYDWIPTQSGETRISLTFTFAAEDEKFYFLRSKFGYRVLKC